MKFSITTLYDNGSGMKYFSKEEFLNMVSNLIDEAEETGFNYFHIDIDAGSEV